MDISKQKLEEQRARNRAACAKLLEKTSEELTAARQANATPERIAELEGRADLLRLGAEGLTTRIPAITDALEAMAKTIGLKN